MDEMVLPQNMREEERRRERGREGQRERGEETGTVSEREELKYCMLETDCVCIF
jgi:hypothetical protein